MKEIGINANNKLWIFILDNLKLGNKFIIFMNYVNYIMKVNRTKKKLEYSNLIKAFQRKFRQDLVNGKVDKECYLISKSIQNKR